MVRSARFQRAVRELPARREIETSQRSALNLLIAVLLALTFAATAHAESSLTVDRRTIRAGTTLTVTLVLEGEIAKRPEVDLPAENLFLGEPSISTEFSWVNGRTTRRKIFRWLGTSERAGSATVGPLTLQSDEGDVARFPAISIAITPAPSPPANEREAVERLDSEEPIVVVAEMDSSTAFVGEQRVISWWVYTRSALRSVRVSARPTFADFWIEEIPLDEKAEPEPSSAGPRVNRYLVRRTAIFPVRTGELEIPSLEVTASIMEPLEAPFDRFGLNHRIVEARASSQALTLSVAPVTGSATLVGDVSMQCSAPVTSMAGPVFFDVTLNGDGNLRGAEPPSPVSAIAGRLDWSTVSTRSVPAVDRVQMTRKWRAAIYPERDGVLVIPKMTLAVFAPGEGMRELSCAAATVLARTSSPPNPRPEPVANRVASPEPARASFLRGGLAALGVLIGIGLLCAWIVSRKRRRSSEIRRLVEELHHPDARQMRSRIEALLASGGLTPELLSRESSDLAEEYRALDAAIDLRAREAWRHDELEAQLRTQLALFVEAWRSR